MAEEAKEKRIDVEATKDEAEEGRVGRKEESLESEKDLGEEIAADAALVGWGK